MERIKFVRPEITLFKNAHTITNEMLTQFRAEFGALVA